MKSDSKKVFAVLIGLNLLAMVLMGLVITLIYNNYTSSTESQQQSADEIAKSADLVSLEKLVFDTSDSRQYVSSLFVDKEKVIDFLGFLESLGELSGAKVKIISVDAENKDKPVNYTAIRFEAMGTWEQVFDTVSLVDHLPEAFSVSDLQISNNYIPDSGKSSVLLWSATINIKVLKLHI